MAPAMEPQKNPYAPPKSQHLELPAESGPGPNRHVEWACKLMWIGAGLSTLEFILTTLFSLDSSELVAEIIGGLVGLAIMFALVFWFTVKLRAGRNWMRWLVTILTILGFLLFALVGMVIPRSMLVEIFDAGPLVLANLGIQMLLSLAEVVLINTPAARQWFHARSSELR
jgi:hypothetical protein